MFCLVNTISFDKNIRTIIQTSFFPLKQNRQYFRNTMLTSSERLVKFRQIMDEHNVDVYLVPTTDAHNCEFPPAYAQRRMYISGFTGSAGTAVITKKEAFLWTDGRYFTQAATELDASLWTLMKDRMPGTLCIGEWLKANENVKRIGYDPKVTGIGSYQTYQEYIDCDSTDKVLVPTTENLVDLVWNFDGRPGAPDSNIWHWGDEFAGYSSKSKIVDIRKKMKLDDIAWITNLRASDIEFCPVFVAYLTITRNDTKLYVAPNRLSSEAREYLEQSEVGVRPYESIFDEVSTALNEVKSDLVWMDNEVNVQLFHSIQNHDKRVLIEMNPVAIPKAIKNATELKNMKEAHIKDALAKTTFLAWMERMAKINPDSLATETECTVASQLNYLRSRMPNSMGPSFSTISSIGSNAAVIHYTPNEATAKPITRDLFLVDSGGQYKEGTTDVTRCVHLGVPTDEQTDAYTRVLKGHLALQRQKFPDGIKGPQFDIIPRMALWNVGLDYPHGTGHGVGAFLLVHEGPQGIVARIHDTSSHVDLVPGMIVSNEPGFYAPGKFGIRIENLVYIERTDINRECGTFNAFVDLTLIPHTKKLLKLDLMTDEVWQVLEPRFKSLPADMLPHVDLTLEWLKNCCTPIVRK